MSRHTLEFVQDHNRPLSNPITADEGSSERLCMKCRQWMNICEFVLSHGKPGYCCSACDREVHRIAERNKRAKSIRGMHRLPRQTNEYRFDETKVDVAGLCRFLSMPRPAQLVEGQA